MNETLNEILADLRDVRALAEEGATEEFYRKLDGLVDFVESEIAR